jgi:branched-chain amino acid aminotransferase
MYNKGMLPNLTHTWRVDWLHGQPELHEISSNEPSVDAAMSNLPGGAYTTFRTFNHNRALRLEDHLRRLEETARLTGQPVELDHPGLRILLRRAVEAYHAEEEIRFRLLVDLQDRPGTVYILAERLHVPGSMAYQNGVKVITCRFERVNPKAKLTQTMAGASEVRRSLPEDVNEALIVDPDGFIREGLSSNFFAVKDGVLWTAEEGVLAGITRQLVLVEASTADIPLCYRFLALGDVSLIQEAFITSSSRAVLPVRQIDDQVIGLGVPGPLTQLLAMGYQRRVAQEIEPV